jgi:hypothetical protein
MASARWIASACALALAAGGCGSDDEGGGTTTRATPPPPKVTTDVGALPAPAQRCSSQQGPARVVRLRTRDGVALDGVEAGRGPAGAVLLHQSPSDLCDWWPFARALRQRGVHALMLDLRCNGKSGCPSQSTAFERPALDVEAAAAYLRRRGARSVTVAGASYGGASALVAGAQLGGRVDGVVSLSGEPRLSPALDVPKVIDRLRVPLLLAVAPGDSYVSVAQTRAMLRAAGSKRKRMVVRPAGHGIELLLSADGQRLAPFFDTVVDALRAPSG